MATNAVRVQQRAAAVSRLCTAADAIADALGIDRAVIPTTHADRDYLPIVQINAVGDLLERIAAVMEPTAASDTATANAKADDAAPEPAASEDVADDTTDTADADAESAETAPAPAEPKAANATTKKAR